MSARGELDPGELVTAYVPELAVTSWTAPGCARSSICAPGHASARTTPTSKPRCASTSRSRAAAAATPRLLISSTSTSPALNSRPHGGAFDYRSILTDLLGWIIENARRAGFADLLSRDLWARIGAEHDAEVAVDGHGHPVTDGGISVTCATSPGSVPCREGPLRRPTSHSGELDDDSWRGNDETRIAFAGAPQAERFPGGLYRNQWWAPFPSRAVLLGSGIYGQSLYIDLAAEAVIVKFSTWPEALDLKLADMHLRAFEAVVGALRQAAA